LESRKNCGWLIVEKTVPGAAHLDYENDPFDGPGDVGYAAAKEKEDPGLLLGEINRRGRRKKEGNKSEGTDPGGLWNHKKRAGSGLINKERQVWGGGGQLRPPRHRGPGNGGSKRATEVYNHIHKW